MQAFTFLYQVSSRNVLTPKGLMEVLGSIGLHEMNSFSDIVEEKKPFIQELLELKKKLGLRLKDPLHTVNGLILDSNGDIMHLIETEITRVQTILRENKVDIEQASSNDIVNFEIQRTSQRNVAATDDSLPLFNIAHLFTDIELRRAALNLVYASSSQTPRTKENSHAPDDKNDPI